MEDKVWVVISYDEEERGGDVDVVGVYHTKNLAKYGVECAIKDDYESHERQNLLDILENDERFDYFLHPDENDQDYCEKMAIAQNFCWDNIRCIFSNEIEYEDECKGLMKSYKIIKSYY